MIKKLVFKQKDFKGVILPKEFTADILIEGANIKGEPLVTLNHNEGLPPVKEVYARWGKPVGEIETAEVVLITVRFDDKIEEHGKLKGSLALNFYVEGATNYVQNWVT